MNVGDTVLAQRVETTLEPLTDNPGDFQPAEVLEIKYLEGRVIGYRVKYPEGYSEWLPPHRVKPKLPQPQLGDQEAFRAETERRAGGISQNRALVDAAVKLRNGLMSAEDFENLIEDLIP